MECLESEKPVPCKTIRHHFGNKNKMHDAVSVKRGSQAHCTVR